MPEKMKLERERRRRMASDIGTCSKAASRFAVCMKAMASDEVTISIENSAPRCRNSVRIMALKMRGSRRRSSWGVLVGEYRQSRADNVGIAVAQPRVITGAPFLACA